MAETKRTHIQFPALTLLSIVNGEKPVGKRPAKKLKAMMEGIISVSHAIDEMAEEQKNPFGSLEQFLDKGKFEQHFGRAKEMLASEERAGGIYKAEPKADPSRLKKSRKWVFVIISEDQRINEKISHGTYAALKRKTLVNATAVISPQIAIGLVDKAGADPGETRTNAGPARENRQGHPRRVR